MSAASTHNTTATMRLQGKVAVITGAASGMGRAMAIGFAAEGASVVAGAAGGIGAVYARALAQYARGEAESEPGQQLEPPALVGPGSERAEDHGQEFLLERLALQQVGALFDREAGGSLQRAYGQSAGEPKVRHAQACPMASEKPREPLLQCRLPVCPGPLVGLGEDIEATVIPPVELRVEVRELSAQVYAGLDDYS